jgi:radical SAM protein with 4Fe4S-binding SPASM domain
MLKNQSMRDPKFSLLLRKDWVTLGKAVGESGIRLEMITNGLEVENQADLIADAGFFAVTFSIDGDKETHDELRGVPGGLSSLLSGSRALKERGMLIGAVTQVNCRNINLLDRVYRLLVDNDFDGWQVQLTMPHGEAANDDGAICISPKDLLELDKTLVRLKRGSDLFLQAADNIGYMSRHEPLLRSGTRDEEKFFGGCQAGMQVVGITSDGTVRGCLSLPPSFDEGNIRDRSFREIWNDERAFLYNRAFKVDDLDGACLRCPFNKICRAGCKSLAVAVTGSVQSNPYCLRRLEEEWE